MPERAALYVDGFNMYHALDDLGEAHLKWLNLKRLAEHIVPSQDTVTEVVYCTAYTPSDSNKRWRHQQYLNALELTGVRCEMGHYVHETMKCYNCTNVWEKPTEKEGDINVAIHLFNDAWLNRYDHAYLVTADSDQAATVRLFRAQFPAKKFTTVSPPGRNFSVHIAKHATGRIALSKSHVEACLFPAIVLDPNGNKHGRRPREWDPPAVPVAD